MEPSNRHGTAMLSLLQPVKEGRGLPVAVGTLSTSGWLRGAQPWVPVMLVLAEIRR